MAYTTIDDPSAYFHTQLYTGSSSGQSITNDANAGDFKPDWVWIKRRNGDPNSVGNGHHTFYDSNRGVQKEIYADLQNAEGTNSGGLTAFGTDGFTVGTEARVNSNGLNFVSWQWKANGGTTSSNTSGDINSTVQANTTAGFSIVTYNGNGSSNQTVGHGLGATPDFLLWKNYDTDTSGWDWKTWHTGLTGTNYVRINKSEGQLSSNGDIDALPTSTLFTVGNNGSTNGQSGQNHTIICYAFTSIQGYSKFGKFEGNGSTNGPFVYTGFKPAWLMIKETISGGSWGMWDNKRTTTNPMTIRLLANTSGTDDTSNDNAVDFLSNGFKMRTSSGSFNQSSTDIIYMAFAEHPFVSSKGVPVTAR